MKEKQKYGNKAPLPQVSIPPEVMSWVGQIILTQFTPPQQYTVAGWIDHVIERKVISKRKSKTIDSYKFLKTRICNAMGDTPMWAVTSSMLSEFFSALQSEMVERAPRAVCKAPLNCALSEIGWSKTSFAKSAGIGEATLDRAIQGKPVSVKTAAAISEQLDAPVGSLFSIQKQFKPLSRDTIQDYRRFLSVIFTLAKNEGICPINPMVTADVPMPPKRKKVKTLQPEDVQKVIEAAKKEPLSKQALIHLALITGCRRGELAAIRWQSIKWSESAILIDQEVLYTKERGTYIEEGTKNGRDRLLRLPSETLELLEFYRASLPIDPRPEDYLFPGRHGGPMCPDSIYTYLRRFEDRHGLAKLNPHKFRHTLASILLHSGMDAVTVSHRLGHSQPSTTLNMYGSLILKADMESAEVAADAIFRGKSYQNMKLEGERNAVHDPRAPGRGHIRDPLSGL